MQKKLYLSLISLLLSIIYCHGVNMDGYWKSHPSFYQNVQKIVDGERFTYYLLHQQHYLSTHTDFNTVRTTLFRSDKGNGNSEILPMTSLYEVFPSGIISIAYSPSNRSLIAADSDGLIWVVPDNSDPYSLFGMDNIRIPGKPHINSIIENPSDGKIWIAATFGYSILDPVQEKLTVIRRTDFPIDYICQVGDKIIAFSDGKVLTANAANLPSKQSDFTQVLSTSDTNSSHLVSNSHIASAQCLMPLSSSTFAFIGNPSDENNNGTLGVAVLNGNSWKVYALAQDQFRMQQEANSLLPIADNTASSNKNGYIIHAKNNLYQLTKGINPDLSASDPSADFASKALQTIVRSQDADKESASWDFSNFTFFTNKSGFYTRKNENGSWATPSDFQWPQAPVPYIAEAIQYNPQYGLMISSHSYTTHFTSSGAPNEPLLLSALKDNKWINHSPVFTTPDAVKESSSLSNSFKGALERYPITRPKGMAFDPVKPNYVFFGSDFYGWTRIDMDHPEQMALHIGNKNSINSSLPGFIDDCPVQSVWSLLCAFSGPKFDNDGRLWMLYWDYDEAIKNNYSMSLRFYEQSDLRAIENAHQDPSVYKSMKTIVAPCDQEQNAMAIIVPLTYSVNSTKIAYMPGPYNSSLYIYDHNGTPNNTSDDKNVTLSKFFDSETGDFINLNKVYYLGEDTCTGYIWVSTLVGTFIVDPVLAFSNPEKAARRVWVNTEDGKGKRKILESTIVNNIACDDFGNLWIATNNRGLLCLSPDRTTVVAEFNAANSPLESDKIYSVCYNPENLSMMMSTDAGIVEFFPTIYGGGGPSNVKTYPSVITPDFFGPLTITGLPTNKTFLITDSSGKTVAEIGMPQNGLIQWDCINSYGSHPNQGIYQVRDKSSSEIYATFTIVN